MQIVGFAASTGERLTRLLPEAQKLRAAGHELRWFINGSATQVTLPGLHFYAIVGVGLSENEWTRTLGYECLTCLITDVGDEIGPTGTSLEQEIQGAAKRLGIPVFTGGDILTLLK